MAVGLQTGVPWTMCKQDDAPDPVVSAVTCNIYVIDIYVIGIGKNLAG